MCTMTGGRRYSGNLPQGGLEITCVLVFIHEPKRNTKDKGASI